MENNLILALRSIARDYGNANETFYDAASRYCRDILDLDVEEAANAAYALDNLNTVLRRVKQNG